MYRDEIPLRLPFRFRRRGVSSCLCCRGERRGRILLPDGKIIRGDRQPAKREHISARFGHSSDLRPRDFIDDQLAFPFAFRAIKAQAGSAGKSSYRFGLLGIIVNGCSISCGLSRKCPAYRRPFGDASKLSKLLIQLRPSVAAALNTGAKRRR
jgi:hypothetical protein